MNAWVFACIVEDFVVYLCGTPFVDPSEQPPNRCVVEDFIVYPCSASFVDPCEQPPNQCDDAEHAEHAEHGDAKASRLKH